MSERHFGVDPLHHDNPNGVQLVDHVLRWDADCTNEKGNLFFDHDVREFGQMAFGIIVLVNPNPLSG
jgi:hypothetical protein